MKKNIKNITLILISILLFNACKKDCNHENISYLSTELMSKLDIIAKAFSQLSTNKEIQITIKDAIYNKKKDGNITLKDLFEYENKYNSNNVNSKIQTIDIRTQLVVILAKYNMSAQELDNLINQYNLAIYWNNIQYWDGQKQPLVAYPNNTEDDVTKLADINYKTFEIQSNGNTTTNTMWWETDEQMWIIEPLEDFENGSPNYYSKQNYVWLSDLDTTTHTTTRLSTVQKQNAIEDRLRLYAINTNGNQFDGNGGPEFRFWRVGTDNFITGTIGNFSDIVSINLTKEVACKKNNWIIVRNTVDDIYDDLWLFPKWRQLLGCYEQDGGLNNQWMNIGFVASASLNLLGIKVASADIKVQPKIENRDDQLYQHNLAWTSFVDNIKGKQTFGFGMIDGWPIKNTDHQDLKVAYSNQ